MGIRRNGLNGIAGLSAIVLSCGIGIVEAQAPAKTKLKKVLVLDKSQGGANGHLESRRDFNAALASLTVEKGFTVTTIGQNDPASTIAAEFSAAGLAKYQVVVFSNNDGVHAQLTPAEKENLQAYVEGGGSLMTIHAAQAFISNWPWLTGLLVEYFYGPHGTNQPTANLAHDAEGIREGTETQGIFKGLTAPMGFLDGYYSFRTSPRDSPGVTILLTVDEASFSKPVQGPMGDDHPVVWVKTAVKGRVVNNSLGHSWSTNNAYTAKDGYLTKFLYGTLRYAAGDFVGCMDSRYAEYNPDATQGDSGACITRIPTALSGARGKAARPIVSRDEGQGLLRVEVEAAGPHAVTLLDVSGRPVATRNGAGPAAYALPMPARGGIYFVVAQAGGRTTRHRVTIL